MLQMKKPSNAARLFHFNKIKYDDHSLKLIFYFMKFIIRITLGLLGFLLFADGLYLLLQVKIHLGIFLPLLIGAIFLIHAFFWQALARLLTDAVLLKKLWQSCWVIFTVWLCTLVLFFSYIQLNKNNDSQVPDHKAIIILGSGLIQGKASPTLQARLDKAAEVYKDSSQAILIVTGGLGLGQHLSEATVMAQYLEANHQISASNIMLEDQSTSTELNLKNSHSILKQHQIELSEPIAIVTSDFHCPRAKLIAVQQGYLQTLCYGADTPLETRYNAWLREYFAYISGWVLGEY